jgi:hypothetical protein
MIGLNGRVATGHHGLVTAISMPLAMSAGPGEQAVRRPSGSEGVAVTVTGAASFRDMPDPRTSHRRAGTRR